ncbi:MAG: hypothetical protein P8Y65_05210 [Campylobacterales bacterium]
MHRSSFYTGAAAVLGIGIFLGARLFTPLQADERFQKLENIRLPDGFKIALFAQNVPGARSLALGERGTIFIGTRGAGNVYAASIAPTGSPFITVPFTSRRSAGSCDTTP